MFFLFSHLRCSGEVPPPPSTLSRQVTSLESGSSVSLPIRSTISRNKLAGMIQVHAAVDNSVRPQETSASFVIGQDQTASSATSLSVSTDPAVQDVSTRTRPGLGIQCILITSKRPNGIDHVTPLAHLLVGHVDHLAVYDADGANSSDSRSRFRFADVVVHGPASHIEFLVQQARDDAAHNKHKDSADRIAWRSKEALDYAYALEYAYSLRDRYPYALILEDDSWLARGFPLVLRDLLQPAWSSNKEWLWWALFHCKSYDTRSSYRHGDAYEFKACTQGLLFRAASLRSLISYIKANYQEDPIDFILRNYQYDRKSLVRVVIPSLVQHMGGGGSTFKGKLNVPKKSGCHAFDFGEPAEPIAKDDEERKWLQTQAELGTTILHEMPSDEVQPDAQPRDRNI